MANVEYSRVTGWRGNSTTFDTGDGRKVTVVGDRAMRNNNPGNIRSANWQKSYPGFAGVQGNRNSAAGNYDMSTWSTREDGLRAQAHLLFDRYDQNQTIAQAIASYAPPEDNNNTAAYAAAAALGAGVSPNTRVGDLTDDQKVSMMEAMHTVEGNTSVEAYDENGVHRYTIDRDHPPSYQTKPNEGGFKADNPGGFSPPRPDNQTAAGPKGNAWSVPEQTYGAPVEKVDRSPLDRPASLQPDRQMPGTALSRAMQAAGISTSPTSREATENERAAYAQYAASRSATPALSAAMSKAGLSTSPASRAATANEITGYSEYGKNRAAAPAKATNSYSMRPGDSSLSAVDEDEEDRTALTAAKNAAGINTSVPGYQAEIAPSIMTTKMTDNGVRPGVIPSTVPGSITTAVTQPRSIVVQPVKTQPIQPVRSTATISPVAAQRGLTTADVYSGAIGRARAADGNVVSRESAYGPTTVTNKYGATTGMYNGNQTAVGNFGISKSTLGALAGAAVGSAVAGPLGGLAGAAVGRSAMKDTADDDSGGGTSRGIFGGLFGGRSKSSSVGGGGGNGKSSSSSASSSSSRSSSGSKTGVGGRSQRANG